jgi:hypothetical protein
MVLLVLTPWHFFLVPAAGLVFVLLSYVGHLLSPPPLPPQYILDLSKEQLLAGQETKAAEDAIKHLVEEVPEVSRRTSSRTVIDDEVLTAYNAYKAQCLEGNKQALGLSRWVYHFDPDLYKRVFVNE